MVHAGVRAVVRHDVDVNRAERTVGVGCDTDVLALVATVHGEQVLGACLPPPRGSTQREGGLRDEHVLGVGERLGTESAPYPSGDHPYVCRVEPAQLGDAVSYRVRRLRGHVHRDALVGGHGQRDVGFEGRDRHTLVHHVELDHNRCAGERGVGGGDVHRIGIVAQHRVRCVGREEQWRVG